MMKAPDLTGKRFGSIVVIEATKNVRGRTCWLCHCDCGKEKIVLTNSLIYGKTKSCGCSLIKRNTKHGKYHTRMYQVWNHVKQRCFNKNHKHYRHYGGRGITICNEWLDFDNFHNWAISNGYDDSLSIDRIDVNGNYCPENCRWATKHEQANNTRKNQFIEYNGKRQTISEWSKETGIAKSVIRYRLNHGYEVDKIFSK